MDPRQKTWIVRGAAAGAVALLAIGAWQRLGSGRADDGIASGNGRLEAVEIDVAAKASGRIRELRVAEGDFVTAGQVVALLDTDVLQAQRRQAEAQGRQAESAIATARSQLAQRESDLAAARAVVAQREVEVESARATHERTSALAEKGFVSPQAADDTRNRLEGTRAALAAARAQVAAAQAAIQAARTQVESALSNAGAATANVERFQADIEDTVLKAPRDGRVQYLVLREGEVVAGGGRVVNMLDLSDVSMTFFLPTAAAGRVALGSEARIVLDAAPQFVLPATISFVASEAQFTPKTVETQVEREKLMFRVKARIPPELLRKHIRQVKTGLPGMAHVRIDPSREWPQRLQVKLPP